MNRLRRASPQLLAALLGAGGTLHFLVPRAYDAIVPAVLPAPRFWTYASGVAELACAGLVAVPRTRRLGGLAAAALLVAVFPANVQMALDATSPASRRSPGPACRCRSRWCCGRCRSVATPRAEPVDRRHAAR